MRIGAAIAATIIILAIAISALLLPLTSEEPAPARDPALAVAATSAGEVGIAPAARRGGESGEADAGAPVSLAETAREEAAAPVAPPRDPREALHPPAAAADVAPGSPAPTRPAPSARPGVVTGVVLAAGGEPIAGARVRFEPRADLPTRAIAAVSDPAGVFRLAAPAGAAGDLVVSAPHHLEARIPDVRVGAEPLTIELSEGAGIDGIAMAGGEPLADAVLRLRGAGVEISARTGDQGEFRIRGLRAGEYRISVSRLDLLAGESSGESEGSAVPDHEAVTVAVGEAEVLETEIEIAFERKAPRR